jgi:peptidoglycan/xylan/chitin deacetylase (PgdA/CDA1 family)
MIPFRTPFFLPYLYPSLTWRIPAENKELYLTFDDGPIPGPTEFVLDTLYKTNAKATFFCIGDNIGKNPDVFRKIISAGHTVGNHTYNHLNGWKTDNVRYFENIKACDAQIANNVSLTTAYFRPPYGRMTRRQIQSLQHYKIIMWDVLTHDYSSILSPDACLKRSINATRNGSIIVFHDSVKAERNMVYVLPRFIEHFTARGFSFKSLTP